MKKSLGTVTIFVLTLAFGTGVAFGAIHFEMQPSQPDLTALTIGQSFTINVVITGLQQGQEADLISAEIDFEDPLLDLIIITGGPIIADMAGFEGGYVQLPGEAYADYDSWYTTNDTTITSNGVFFTTQFTAAALGSGTLRLSSEWTDLYLLGANDPEIKTLGAAISFNTTPEPATITLLLLGSSVLLKKRN